MKHRSRYNPTAYSLKAACSNCGQFGTVNDLTLICKRCGAAHDLTDAQRAVRDADLADWQSFQPRQPDLRWNPHLSLPAAHRAGGLRAFFGVLLAKLRPEKTA